MQLTLIGFKSAKNKVMIIIITIMLVNDKTRDAH